jgi:hypothetical protein
MPQPVKVRADYRYDSAFLLRFEEAIGLDTKHSPLWKKSVSLMSRAEVRLLLDDKESGLVETVQGLIDALQLVLSDAQDSKPKSARKKAP